MTASTQTARLFYFAVTILLFLNSACGFSAPIKMLYDIPGSTWTSPQWNWGYAVGTGHDCAMICRQRWSTRDSRAAFVQELLHPDNTETLSFEEVKLVMALAWQKGRWDGSDGGKGGYGEVLEHMANAKRYEKSSEQENAQHLVRDMKVRYHLLDPRTEDANAMEKITCENDNWDSERRHCAGLVLKSMEFIKRGL